MKRNYISPEFSYNKVYGSFNMEEEPSFFSSKMLEIEDSLNIKDDNLIYYQLPTREQLDEKTEKTLTEVVYDAVSDKSVNHKLFLDKNQSEVDKNGNAKWILTIDLKSILTNYLFATLKKNRTFEGIRNSMVISNNVDKAMSEYIDRNIFYRYKLSKIELYLLHLEISVGGNLQYANIFDQYIEDSLTQVKGFRNVLSDDETQVSLYFNQTENAEEFCFSYYFNIYYEKL